MLVLSRRENEEITFPDLGITVRVVKVKGKRIAIGIDAPADVRISRSELPPKVAPDSTATEPIAGTIAAESTDCRRRSIPTPSEAKQKAKTGRSTSQTRRRGLARVS